MYAAAKAGSAYTENLTRMGSDMETYALTFGVS